MNWNDLPVLLAIARTGSLAGAARLLGVNHSTVFRRLNAAERALNARVFDRLAHGYVPTDLGRDLLVEAEHAADAVAALERRAVGGDLALTGDVRLTATSNLALGFLPAVVERLAREQPGIRLEVVASETDYDLSRREADLALRATVAPPEHLVGRKVVDIDWFVMGSRRYLKKHGRPERFEDLAGHRVIGGDAGFRQRPQFAALDETVPRDHLVATSNSLAVMAAMAARGLGLALLPVDQIEPALERLFPVTVGRRAGLWLLTHPDLRGVARIRTVADLAIEVLRADPRLAPSG